MDKKENIDSPEPIEKKTAVCGQSETTGYKQDYAYSTIDEYEQFVGYRVNKAFRSGWNMARITKKQIGL